MDGLLTLLLPMLKPLLFPVISLLGTQIVKLVWERYLFKLPRVALLAIAGAIGATTGEWVTVIDDPALSKEIGAMLGLTAALIHDAVTPPKPQGLVAGTAPAVKPK